MNETTPPPVDGKLEALRAGYAESFHRLQEFDEGAAAAFTVLQDIEVEAHMLIEALEATVTALRQQVSECERALVKSDRLAVSAIRLLGEHGVKTVRVNISGELEAVEAPATAATLTSEQDAEEAEG